MDIKNIQFVFVKHSYTHFSVTSRKFLKYTTEFTVHKRSTRVKMEQVYFAFKL